VIPPGSNVLFRLKSTSPYEKLSQTQFSNIAHIDKYERLDEDATFLRINTEKFSITWHQEHSGNYNIVGFIAEAKEPDNWTQYLEILERLFY
jgi:hypothetical protein